MNDEPKQYAQRSAIELDRAGGYFSRHLSAMTGEKLHAKSDIAAELAWRDWRIAKLAEENERLRKEVHDLNWALGTDGYATRYDPADQAESEAANAAVLANLDKLKARKARHDALLPDGRDALDEIERLRAALEGLHAPR